MLLRFELPVLFPSGRRGARRTVQLTGAFARSMMARSSTSQPAASSSCLASSISLWLMPSLQGTKIMASAADDAAAGEAELLRRLAHRGDTFIGELHRGRVPDLLEVEGEADLGR